MTQEIIRTPAMIAGEINAIKEQVRNTAIIASVEIGRKLKEARELVPDGEWTEWLDSHVAYSVRTAQNLMALAEEFDAGHAKALESLPYTKAVMLLSVPREEREEFAESHDLDAMSTRELQKEISALRKKNGEMQITMDELIRQVKDSPVEDLKRQTADLEGKLAKANGALETAKQMSKDLKDTEKNLRQELTDAKQQLQAAQDTARQEKEELERALRDAKQPVIQQVTPPDVEEELASLRKQLQRSQEETALRASYELISHSMDRLETQLTALGGKDPELGSRFRRAFARGLRIMADNLEHNGEEAQSA